MLDEEKDLFIKKKFQQDKTISSKANNIFKNFENQYLTTDENELNKTNEKINEKSNEKEIKSNEKVLEFKSYNFLRKIRNYTAVAASFVVAVSVGAGAAIYGNVNKGKTDYTMVNIDSASTASDYTVAEIKNEEVKVEENIEKKVHENNLIKAVLTTDGSVAIKLKKDFLDYHKLKADTTKMYKVSGIKGKVKDIFVCSMISKKYPYVLLLMEDGTVEVVQVYNKVLNESKSGYNFNFNDQGKIKGLKNVIGFEEKTEPWTDEDESFFYVNAIFEDGSKKIIDNIDKVNMEDVSKNRVSFTSQDGEKTYSIYADEDKYIQAFGWAGASNNIYYINDNCLYHLSIVDGSTEKLVTGVESIRVDNDGIITVKLKLASYIHIYDQYITLEQYNVSSSKVIDTKEDENMKICLKEDGSITVELKHGSIETCNANKKFKEKYIYNFYAKNYKVSKSNDASDYYSNSVAIYFGEMGTLEKNYFAFATKDNEVVVIDIYKYIIESVSGTFENEPGDTKYEVLNGKHYSSVDNMDTIDIKMKLEDGRSKDCKSIEVTYTDGKKSIIPVAPILNNEGYKNYIVNYEQK